jgi:mannose-6-phosphate isomerase-like protein (cupin superfamily)
MPMQLDTPTRADELVQLLAAGKDYLWHLRQTATQDGQRLDPTLLRALRALEPAMIRPPHPSHKRVDHRYLRLELPGDVGIFFSPLVCEAGVESGTEIFPATTTWTFAHHEVQTCTGGDSFMEAVLLGGALETKRFRAGDVMAIPEGTHVTFDPQPHGRPHAHIFVTNLPGRTFYDGVPLQRLRANGLLKDGETPQEHDVSERVEVLDWSELVRVRPDGARQLPTWLRNGWGERESTRALDYAEGTRSLVITSPDRAPDDYLEWGAGTSVCRVNPLICEAAAAVTDCVLLNGWAASLPDTELWTVLAGEATVRQTLAPLHVEAADARVRSGDTLVVPAGARTTVDDADHGLMVRRTASSGSRNGHWAMMETKLRLDGYGTGRGIEHNVEER